MEKVAVLLSVGFFSVLVVLIVSAPKGDGTPSSRDRSVTDPGQYETLETDQQMLERMRASVSPHVGIRINQNPTWVNPDMVRLQEDYLAQLDRMIGRRRSQP